MDINWPLKFVWEWSILLKLQFHDVFEVWYFDDFLISLLAVQTGVQPGPDPPHILAVVVAHQEGHEDEEDHDGAEDDDQHDLIGEPAVHLPVGDGDLVPDGLSALNDRLQADIVGGALGEDIVSDAQCTHVVVIRNMHRVAVNFGITPIYNAKKLSYQIYHCSCPLTYLF